MPTAAAHAVLDILKKEEMVDRAAALEPVLENAIRALKGLPTVLDIRNCGLAAAIDLEPLKDQPGLRGMRVLEKCIENGILVRISGDGVVVCPPFISTPEELENLVATLGQVIQQLA
jgi:beta-alanine--pyruvate transaminase